MSIKEKLAKEDGTHIYCYKQGAFWVCYEQSAYIVSLSVRLINLAKNGLKI